MAICAESGVIVRHRLPRLRLAMIRWLHHALCYNCHAEMKLTRKEVQHIALLARLGLSEEEIEKFRIQLSDILENFEILKQLDTTDIPPTAQSISLQNILRPDESKASYPTEEILANAPQREGNSFKVRAVLE